MIVLFSGLRWGRATLTHRSASVPLIRLFSSYLLEMPRGKTATVKIRKVGLTDDNERWNISSHMHALWKTNEKMYFFKQNIYLELLACSPL